MVLTVFQCICGSVLDLEKLYRIATDDTIELHDRYKAARLMQLERKYPAKREKKRDYKAEYKRRREMWGV